MSRSSDRPPSLARELGRLTAEADSGVEFEVPGWLSVAGYTTLVVLLLFALFGTSPATVLGVALLVVVVGTVYSAVEVVQAYERAALTVFGEYRGLLEPGLNLVVPFVSRATTFDLRTQTVDVPTQEAITRDNSPVTADAVVYVRVMDAERTFLEVDDYRRATLLLAQTTLRAVIGDMELDETLSRRDRINERIRRELDRPTDEWGVRVESVEVREVKPSADVENAMEEQTSAERRRRATILEAQGERRSAVERAQGDRQSNVLRAQGEKRASVLEAQGDAISTVLRARSAESMGERAIVDKGMETLSEIGGSESTTFLLPQELTSLVGRYGRRLTGGDVSAAGSEGLDSGSFDAETTTLLGLDEIESLATGEGRPNGEGAADEPTRGPGVETADRRETDEEWE
jgi:regulator of protease activity HflC (stomatin/prohibitin superfamily)